MTEVKDLIPTDKSFQLKETTLQKDIEKLEQSLIIMLETIEVYKKMRGWE